MEHTCAACGKTFYTDIQFCDDCEEGEAVTTNDLIECYRRHIEWLEARIEIRERRIAELEKALEDYKAAAVADEAKLDDQIHSLTSTVTQQANRIEELVDALAWALGFPTCRCFDHDNRWQEQSCSCGHANKLQAAFATMGKQTPIGEKP
jgi:hypothetical protein